MRRARLPISLKLLGVLLGMATLSTGLALTLQDRALARDLERAAGARLDGAAEAARLLVAGHLESLHERYRAISGTPQFRAHLELGDVPTLTYYAEQIARREGAALIGFRDQGGHTLALAGDSSLPVDLEPGLVAHAGRPYAVVELPLETGGASLGSLVAVEPVTAETLGTWSALCGARIELAAHAVRGTSLERVVQPLGADLELRAVASLEAERDALAHSRVNLLAAGSVALVACFAASFFLSRGIVRPVLRIQAATERIAGGDFDVRTHSDRRDEIGDVARAFDDMLERLRLYLSELRRSRERLESAQRLARMGSWQVDLQSGELSGSAEFHAILGLEGQDPAKAVPQALVLERIHREDRADFERVMRVLITDGIGFSLNHRVVVDGSERILHTQARVLSDPESGARRLEGTVQDVTDRTRIEEQVRFLAYHDSLTGLGNRRMLAERLGLAIGRARRSGSSVGLLFLGLDHFKRINDTLGHGSGDRLLRQVADRLVALVRDSDLVAHEAGELESAVSRLGGDEFTLLLPEVDDPRNLAKVAQRVLAALAEPFGLDRQVIVGGSIGIATWPLDGEDAETLLRNADTALHHAKEQGRNNYQFYTESMNAASLRRLTLEQNLRRALEGDELELHYQPKVELAHGRITGLEALLRWRDPEAGLMMPGDFIPVAEESGLIVPLGEWVLRAACAQIASWQARGRCLLPVAVNLSAHQFRSGHLVETVSRILRETGIEPRLLEIEITESTLVREEASVVAALEALRARGIRVAIDDFGTGYSSLAYLRRLPVDTLKIDRSFVQHIEESRGDAALAAAIVSMGRALDLKLVAEGVETAGQRELLRGWGCDELQGFVFSPALPPAALEELWDGPAGAG